VLTHTILTGGTDMKKGALLLASLAILLPGLLFGGTNRVVLAESMTATW